MPCSWRWATASRAHCGTIDAGNSTTCAVTEQQRVYCWGDNRHAQAGVPLVTDDAGITSGRTVSAPTELTLEPGGRPVRELAGGDGHFALLAESGSVWTWGSNYFGQLGRQVPRCDDSAFVYDCSAVPGQAATLGTAGVQIAVAGSNTCVLTGQGAIKCLGEPPQTSATPLDAIAFMAGDDMSNIGCVLRANDSVYCWGWLQLESTREVFSEYPEATLVQFPSE